MAGIAALLGVPLGLAMGMSRVFRGVSFPVLEVLARREFTMPAAMPVTIDGAVAGSTIGAHVGDRGRRRDDRDHPGRARLHDAAGVRRQA